jgi:toxin secretion/phage lysis holin
MDFNIVFTVPIGYEVYKKKQSRRGLIIQLSFYLGRYGMNWEALFKVGATVTGGFVGWAFGGWSVLLQVLLALVVIDYLTGLLASGVEGKLSSKVGFKGIAKKLMIFSLVAVGHLIDKLIGDGSMVQNAIIFFFVGNEVLSVVENAGRSGLPIPPVLTKAVEVLQSKGKTN